MHRYVMVQMKDGSHYDGIVENVDDENLYLAVPVGEAESMEARQYPGYGYGGYGVPLYGYTQPGLYGYQLPGYGHGFPRRRFRRSILPLAALLALTLLPYY
ncbi:MAG TPA: hypothetical protein VGE40_05030 [Bacilli bacterium]